MTVTNQNLIQEEIKRRLNSGSAEPSVFSSAVKKKKKFKIRIYRAIILPLVLYGCETWSLH
jgi:hypothetical protein